MATKRKPKEKLSPIPRPSRRKADTPISPAAATENAMPDLSYIAQGLHGLVVPIGDLLFDPANARKHPEASVSAIAASLRVYGQCKPVVARRDNGVVIAGNGTLQAALSLGWTHLAAVKVDFDGATAAGFSISDNRTAELSEWDKDALDALLREVSTQNDERLDQMLAELAEEMKIVPQEETSEEAEPAPDESDLLQEKFQILVVCKDEQQQGELLERFTGEGLECRSLTV